MTISTIAELSSLLEEHFQDGDRTTVVYRGHGAASFTLKPKVGRCKPPTNSGRSTVNEELMLELFKRQSPDRLSIATESEWELLAIAQHHGMATRLLDWTRNPLAALYFAVSKECESREKTGQPRNEDAEIIVWRSPKVDLTSPLPASPFKLNKPENYVKYVPRFMTPRLRVQSGLFTVHEEPAQVFLPSGIEHIKIPYRMRKPLKDALNRHGVNESVLFPDVDGLARHIEWLQTECY